MHNSKRFRCLYSLITLTLTFEQNMKRWPFPMCNAKIQLPLRPLRFQNSFWPWQEPRIFVHVLSTPNIIQQ